MITLTLMQVKYAVLVNLFILKNILNLKVMIFMRLVIINNRWIIRKNNAVTNAMKDVVDMFIMKLDFVYKEWENKEIVKFIKLKMIIQED